MERSIRRLVRRRVNSAVHAGRRWIERAGEITPGTEAADGFGSFGDGSCIGFPPATLMGTRAIHLGRDTLVGRHATLSVGYAEDDPDLDGRRLVIGDRCVLGARVTILAHRSVEIGDDVWFGQNVFVCDAGHGYQDPDLPVGQQLGPQEPVVIGPGSWIGHGAIVLPGARLGRNVVVAAGSVVRGTVPDHTIVAGAPARAVRRLEEGVGWVGVRGDVRPVLQGPLGTDGDGADGADGSGDGGRVTA